MEHLSRKYIYAIIIIVFIISSCGKSDEQLEKERDTAIDDSLSTVDSVMISRLNTKYDAVVDWSSKKRVTLLIQNALEANLSRPLSVNGVVEDVIRTDSGYTLIIKKHELFKSPKLFKIITVKDVAENIANTLQSRSASRDGCFIIRIKSSRIMTVGITALVNTDEGEPTGYLDFGFGKSLLVIDGILVDYVLKNNRNALLPDFLDDYFEEHE